MTTLRAYNIYHRHKQANEGGAAVGKVRGNGGDSKSCKSALVITPASSIYK